MNTSNRVLHGVGGEALVVCTRVHGTTHKIFRIGHGRDGSIYVDTFRGNGWASRSLIAVIRPDKSIRVLWRGP